MPFPKLDDAGSDPAHARCMIDQLDVVDPVGATPGSRNRSPRPIRFDIDRERGPAGNLRPRVDQRHPFRLTDHRPLRPRNFLAPEIEVRAGLPCGAALPASTFPRSHDDAAVPAVLTTHN